MNFGLTLYALVLGTTSIIWAAPLTPVCPASSPASIPPQYTSNTCNYPSGGGIETYKVTGSNCSPCTGPNLTTGACYQISCSIIPVLTFAGYGPVDSSAGCPTGYYNFVPCPSVVVAGETYTETVAVSSCEGAANSCIQAYQNYVSITEDRSYEPHPTLTLLQDQDDVAGICCTADSGGTGEGTELGTSAGRGARTKERLHGD